MKILHVVPRLEYGGIEKVISNYRQVLDDKKYSFEYVTHGKEMDYHSSLTVHYLDTIGKVGFFSYCCEIKELLDLSAYDVVHIHTGDLTGIYALAYKVCGAKKIICHAHTAAPVTAVRSLIHPLLRFLSLSVSDINIACGEDAGRYCFGKNYVVLPNAIKVEDYYCSEPRNTSDIVLCNVGAFIEQKNQMFLIRVFSKLQDERFKLVLVGDGPLKEKAVLLVKSLKLENRIKFTGIRKDVNKILQNCDLFVMPSLFEGLPVSGLEAQAAGLTCIFSDKIDHGVDMGCSKVEFVELNEDKWVSEIVKASASLQKAPLCKVKEAFVNKKYDLLSQVNKLSELYDKFMLC